MKNRDKDVIESWIFKTYLKIFFYQEQVKMNELYCLQKFMVETPIIRERLYANKKSW